MYKLWLCFIVSSESTLYLFLTLYRSPRVLRLHSRSKWISDKNPWLVKWGLHERFSTLPCLFLFDFGQNFVETLRGRQRRKQRQEKWMKTIRKLEKKEDRCMLEMKTFIGSIAYPKKMKKKAHHTWHYTVIELTNKKKIR